MALKDLVGSPSAAVDAQVIADLAALGWTDTLTVGLGRSMEASYNATPSVVWIPTTDLFDAPALPVARQASGNGTPQALHTRWAGVDCRIWARFGNLPAARRPAAEDYSATEELVNTVIRAVRYQLAGCYQLRGGTWIDAQGAEDMTHGRAYVLHLALAIPVWDQVGQSAVKTITSLPQTRVIGSTSESP